MTRSNGAAGIIGSAAGLCLVLAGCGAGAATPPPASTGNAPSDRASAAVAGRSAPPADAQTGPGSAGLTGSFCTDFSNISQHVAAIPGSDYGHLAALKLDAIRLLTQAAGYFGALAGEAPASVASALHTLAATYQRAESVAASQTSAPAFVQLIHTTQYSGSSLTALGVVGRYDAAHCS